MALRLRLGRPRGVFAWTLVALDAVAFLGAGPVRGPHRLPFFGMFGERPLGITSAAWLITAIVLTVAYSAQQMSRGDVTSIDDHPTTTLRFNEK
jgi:hypothetical protein